MFKLTEVLFFGKKIRILDLMYGKNGQNSKNSNRRKFIIKIKENIFLQVFVFYFKKTL